MFDVFFVTVFEYMDALLNYDFLHVNANDCLKFACIDRYSTKLTIARDCNSVANKKTKNLTRGELRRVSIAEEIVHGPMLVS